MQGKRIFFQVLFFILFLSFHSVGQQTAIYKDPEYTFRKALELFEKQKYGAARQEFKKVAEEEPAGSVQLIALSEYYGALCALELYNKDGEQLMLSFIHNHPESSNVPSARFRLGRFYFSQKRYKDAARNFEMSDPAVLSNADVAEYYFKLGYSYFILNDFQKAVKAFHEIRGTDTKYASPALFYYSHIEYQNRNYETALQNFFKLRNAEGFTQIVPYYIAQIYYLQAKYDSLIAYAPALIERSGIQNTAEIARLLGDAYFRKSDYKNAAEYLELYGKNGGKTSREDIYQLGFSLYKTGQFDEALNNLEKVTDKKDSLSQNALYVMADCYLKTGSRQKARNSFLLASAEDFDKAVKEESFLNYAKLSSELGMQSEAINAFQKYLRMYPASSRRDEINEILAGLFLQTKNYKEALEALESIKAKSEKIRKAYQKVAYFRGVELYSNLMFNEAAEYFEKALKYDADQLLKAQSLYWLAEIKYRRGNYDDAAKGYLSFLYHPNASATGLHNLVNYNLGYCYFKKEDYSNALGWFRKFIENRVADKRKANDAFLRVADCHFVLKDYESALSFYDRAIREKAFSSDYALLQKGVIKGIQNKPGEKIAILQELVERYPGSTYADDALFEQASAYQLQSENLQALNLYNDIVDRYPSSSYVRKALLSMALLYYNEKRDEKALDIYKQVISDYPGSPESREALTGIKNIYVNAGDAEGYVKYASQFSFANISETARDSLLFEAAEQKYLKDGCDKAFKDFNNYAETFKNGIFILNARFYRAECYMKDTAAAKALEDYEFIISKPKNTFTERSLLQAARLYFLGRKYEKSLEHFTSLEKIAEYKANALEAQVGQMRAAFAIGRYDQAAAHANKVLSSGKLSEELLDESHLVRAIYLVSRDSLKAAEREFEIVAKSINTEKGSEAKYNIAEIQFRQQRYKESEKTVFELINNSSSDYWVAKGYILLADNYSQQGDLFQAKATLKSIIDNYEGPDLKAVAQKKLDEIVLRETTRKEEEKSKQKQEAEPVLDLEPKTP